MNVNSESLKQILEMLRDALEPIIRDKIEEVKVKIKDEYIPKLKKFVEDILKSKNVKYESVDVLSKSDLISLIRLNRVNGSDGVAAFKQQKDEKMFVYLAYCKDRDLLPEETNCYIVIEANSLNDDVNELFNESDLIILN
jgi:hypothetical protein